ncbi:unnamed protein product [Amoebophrya sp. A120]|nr:unnamed protein product [Amoebophrya sp. A120]|eukprot:GSA120T00000376001.1
MEPRFGEIRTRTVLVGSHLVAQNAPKVGAEKIPSIRQNATPNHLEYRKALEMCIFSMYHSRPRGGDFYSDLAHSTAPAPTVPTTTLILFARYMAMGREWLFP